jgi:hypothetical protein
MPTIPFRGNIEKIIQKYGILHFLLEERSRMRDYLFFVLFFFPGVIVLTQWSWNIVGGLIATEIKISSALFK